LSHRQHRGPRATPGQRVGRRTFVGLLGAGAVAGVAAANGLVVGTPRAGAAPAAGARPDGVEALGNAYLRAYPREADPAFLLAHLPGIDTTRGVRGQMHKLVPAITRDFAAGRVVTVQGWQLSRTEARAAAAVALGA
jgi:hypothetical protein